MTAFPEDTKGQRTLPDPLKSYRTAGGEILEDEGGPNIDGHSEYGDESRLTGRTADVHKPLVSAASEHRAGRCTWLQEGGGWVFPTNSTLADKVKNMIEQHVKHGKEKGSFPLCRGYGAYVGYIKSGTQEVAAAEETCARWALRTYRFPLAGGAAGAALSPTETRPGGEASALGYAQEETEAEMEGQLEAAVSRVPRAGRRPTAAEIEHHAAMGHNVFRDWRGACLMARGLRQLHVLHGGDRPDADPVAAMGYAFTNGGDDATDDRRGAQPILVAKDRTAGVIAGASVKNKGVNEFAIAWVCVLMRHLGYTYRRIIFQSDGEPSICALKTSVTPRLPAVEVVLRESPEGDHRANGKV